MRPASCDAERLGKTVALLDSPVEGERHAAFEAVRRQLDSLGLRVRDVIRVPPPAPGVRIHDRDTNWRQRARDLLGEDLDDWAESFCRSLARWKSQTISERQHETLQTIEAQHGP